jgi:hypothetical protein
MGHSPDCWPARDKIASIHRTPVWQGLNAQSRQRLVGREDRLINFPRDGSDVSPWLAIVSGSAVSTSSAFQTCKLTLNSPIIFSGSGLIFRLDPELAASAPPSSVPSWLSAARSPPVSTSNV